MTLVYYEIALFIAVTDCKQYKEKYINIDNVFHIGATKVRAWARTFVTEKLVSIFNGLN